MVRCHPYPSSFDSSIEQIREKIRFQVPEIMVFSIKETLNLLKKCLATIS